MTLNTNYCEFESIGATSVYKATAVTSIVPGRGVQMDTAGGVVIAAAVTKIIGVSMDTPASAGDSITVVHDGIVKVTNSGASTYDLAVVGQAYDGGMPIYMDSTGHWTATDAGSSSMTGQVLEKIQGEDAVTAWVLRIKFKCNMPTA